MRKLLLIMVMLLSACGYAPHKDPEITLVANANEAIAVAKVEAQIKHGYATTISCCGSMKPLIQDGDVVVIIPSMLSDDMLGRVGSYRPRWANGGNIVHRLVAGSAKEGFIASGDNNPRSEANERVTVANFNGEVVAIYRVK